jgi:hypothetical protein
MFQEMNFSDKNLRKPSSKYQVLGFSAVLAILRIGYFPKIPPRNFFGKGI